MVDEQLLALLECPSCRDRLELGADGGVLACRGCGRRYPVRDGTPVLLVEEAEATRI